MRGGLLDVEGRVDLDGVAQRGDAGAAGERQPLDLAPSFSRGASLTTMAIVPLESGGGASGIMWPRTSNSCGATASKLS